MSGHAGKTKVVLLVLAAALAGCSGETGKTADSGGGKDTDGGNSAKAPSAPETVTIFPNVPVTDADFQLLFVDPVKKRYPHITIEQVKGNMDNMITSGQLPDIVLTHNGMLAEMKDKGLTADLSPLIKTQNFALDRFDPVYIDSIRAVSDKDELYAIPYGINYTMLFYNKDLFDKFGIAYPRDGMTWTDAIDLARKLSRSDGGVKYRGLDPEGAARLGRQLGVDFSDFKTKKALVNGEKWRTIFEITKAVYTIPGNEPADVNNSQGQTDFIKNKNLAMFATVNILDQLKEAEKDGLSWDIAQYPSVPGYPEINSDVDEHLMLITGTSKHRLAALQVADAVTSLETQLLSVRKTARLSPLKDPAVKQNFGAELDYLKGKRLDSALKGKTIAAPIRTKYYTKTKELALQSFKEYVNGKDLNTALREAEEKINQYIASDTK